jgi:hypothetical protein
MNQLTASRSRNVQGSSLARGLGWFSVALGAVELLAPRAVARATGIRMSPALMRLYGLREIACGIGILASRDPSPFLAARLGGDALDLITVAGAPHSALRGARRRRIGAIVNVASVTALDAKATAALAADRNQRRHEAGERFSALYSDRSGFPRSPEEMRGAASRT